VNEELDTTLWNSLRAIEERILLLREMEDLAREENDSTTAAECDSLASATEQEVKHIRKLVLSHSLFGRKGDAHSST
jgi:two-component system chemotaxis response regulator CheB